MADETDFSALYRELGTSPEVSVDAFRQAYRRRVGQLHPDHAGNEADVARLQWLNRLYGAATRFHRDHGRLPGACPTPRAARAATAPEDAGIADPRSGGDADAAGDLVDVRDGRDSDAPAGRTSFSRYYVVVALVAIIALASRLPDSEHGAGIMAAGVDAPGGAETDASGVAWITIGMEAPMVRLIEGPPLVERKERWDYGPSWIEFRCGKVAAWYSSPRRRLQVRRAEEGRAEAVPKAAPGKAEDGC